MERSCNHQWEIANTTGVKNDRYVYQCSICGHNPSKTAGELRAAAKQSNKEQLLIASRCAAMVAGLGILPSVVFYASDGPIGLVYGGLFSALALGPALTASHTMLGDSLGLFKI